MRCRAEVRSSAQARHPMKLICIFWLGLTLLHSPRLVAQSGKEELVTDSSAVRVLKGTLLIPDGPGSVNVVLIIAGSGPTDRDGNSPALKSGYLKLLAESLADNGIASLRYDKRGISKSKFFGREEELVLEDFANDAARWVDWLRKDKRFSKVVVAGHSEGSLLGMLAAQRVRVDGFISLAGAGRPIDTILKEQLHANTNNPAQLIQSADQIIDSLKMGLRVRQVPSLLSGLFRPSIQPFLISWMKYDPAQEFQRLHMPAMIVQGTTDIQVSMADAEALANAKPTAVYLIIEGMNHVFREAPSDRAENIKTYFQPTQPLKAELVRGVVEFVRKLK